ncbi:hypothetical protein [Lactiplantibacillus mudanjiangensis]|uniref:Uncharacterized protein n=1 Tax=Lactiplantibacillus mudanjiangensis TaxID=1296538 RepID=A0A660E7P6_9LACO|nr:hypothetical protein [Lactiplantibacillus mudanjiangensis]VDG26062.1 hypothetical protein [Lactobacillus brevis] [Lactiplantibacillus mudanjiangensis]VDG29100.1 hypothetical protein [Lactobacillus brevis] [Lactiplantibacillus mudanjiangensis]
MKQGYILTAMLVALLVSGCGQNNHSAKVSASSSTTKKVVKKKTTKKKPKYNPKVGKVISSTKGNLDGATFKFTNKKGKFYRTLQGYGKKSSIVSDYPTDKHSTLAIFRTYKTTKGIFYHVMIYQDDGFLNKISKDRMAEYKWYSNGGYVKPSDLTRFYPVKQQWQLNNVPYYVANPWLHAIWNAPVMTKHRTYVTHVFDRYTRMQLYATKELVRYNGAHYLYLRTANKNLGWVYKGQRNLVQGTYTDPGTQLLNPQSTEKMTEQEQSTKSTGNRVGVNDSLSTQQRLYVVRNAQGQIVRLLAMTMDNRPIQINFQNGKPTKLINYSYRRNAWKVITDSKKLTTSYTARNGKVGVEAPAIKTTFYPKSQTKLVTIKATGYDGAASIVIHRDGTADFETHAYKKVLTYSLSHY